MVLLTAYTRFYLYVSIYVSIRDDTLVYGSIRSYPFLYVRIRSYTLLYVRIRFLQISVILKNRVLLSFNCRETLPGGPQNISFNKRIFINRIRRTFQSRRHITADIANTSCPETLINTGFRGFIMLSVTLYTSVYACIRPYTFVYDRIKTYSVYVYVTVYVSVIYIFITPLLSPLLKNANKKDRGACFASWSFLCLIRFFLLVQNLLSDPGYCLPIILVQFCHHGKNAILYRSGRFHLCFGDHVCKCLFACEWSIGFACSMS